MAGADARDGRRGWGRGADPKGSTPSELHRPGVSCARVEPIRTCLGCRARAEIAQLVRIAASGDQAVIDLDRRLPGRGAWVHPAQRCVERALRAIPRALRQRHLDATPITRWAQDGLDLSPDRRNERPMDN